jgi:hypothetical protein
VLLRAVLCERRGVRFPGKPLVPLAV